MKQKKVMHSYGWVWVVLMLLVLVLGACGKQPEPEKAASPAAASNTDAGKQTNTPASNAPTTKMFKAANGTIEVPDKPQRIVTLAPNYAGYLLTLGVAPLGVPEFTLGNPYLKGKLDNVVNLGANAAIEPALEQVLALKPDLIIGLTALKNVEQLSKIAPVVTFEATKNYKEVLTDLGKLTNKETQAKAWLDQWDAKMKRLKPQVDAVVKGKSFSIMYPSAKGIYLFREGYGRGTEILYGEFGLKMPEKAAQTFKEGQGFSVVSTENLPELAGDFIITAPWLGDAAGAGTVYDSPIWKGLPAVKSGQAYNVDYNIFTFSDPFSWQGQLTIILDQLLPNRDKSKD
ncbi:MAG: iron(3+)-hydroxamate-binding protein fhuD [Paenibacillus sp.]|nr:iron(3+)-hydroxamate-binding protein fhuD [Paenibacillus sp.]